MPYDCTCNYCHKVGHFSKVRRQKKCVHAVNVYNHAYDIGDNDNVFEDYEYVQNFDYLRVYTVKTGSSQDWWSVRTLAFTIRGWLRHHQDENRYSGAM